MTSKSDIYKPIQYTDSPFAPIPVPEQAPIPKPTREESFASHAGFQMILVHNTFIRALNAIYINAPLVKTQSGAKAYSGFVLETLASIEKHHHIEENVMFPALQGAGIPMEENVKQHAEFSEALEELKKYTDTVQRGHEEFDGEKMRALLKAFAGPLVSHLTEEVNTPNSQPWYRYLDGYSPPTFACHRSAHSNPKPWSALTYKSSRRCTKVRIAALRICVSTALPYHPDIDAEVQQGSSLLKTLPFFLVSHKPCSSAPVFVCFSAFNKAYEHALTWPLKQPPVPAPLGWVNRNILYRFHSDWWQFGPFTTDGQPQTYSEV